MIRINRNRLEKAINKARQVHTHVKPIELRAYAVTNPEGRTYKVRFEIHNGRKYGTCTCPAGENEMPCYHLAASLQAHLILMRIRADIKQAGTKPAPVRRDSRDYQTYEDFCLETGSNICYERWRNMI